MEFKKIIAAVSALSIALMTMTSTPPLSASQLIKQTDLEEDTGLPLHTVRSVTAKLNFDISDGCFPESTKLSFDNMSLTDNNDDRDINTEKPYEWNDISVNQLGYITDFQKQATYAPSNGESGRFREPVKGEETVPFSILDKDGKTVYSSVSHKGKTDPDSGNYTYVLDFSDFKEIGSQYRVAVGEKKSYEFQINSGREIYNGMYGDAMNFFYQNRSGIPIESKYIESGRYDSQVSLAGKKLIMGKAAQDRSSLARKAGYPEEKAYIQTLSRNIYNFDGSDVEKKNTQDVTGGWYNACDYSKDVAEGAQAAWTIANIYERSAAHGIDNTYGFQQLKIPENENQIPDILDEIKYEIDFLMKMIVPDGEKKGMVYSEVQNYRWSGLAVTPAQITSDKEFYRIIDPPTTQATLDAAAVCAQFARLYRKYDSDYADKCLETAKSAYCAAKENDDTSLKNGVYYTGDEFYWAACELWLTTGDDSYLLNMKGSSYYPGMLPYITGYEINNVLCCFNSDITQALGTMSLAANYKKLPEDMNNCIKDSVCDAADKFIEAESLQGYGVPFEQSKIDGLSEYGAKGYAENSNNYIINNAMIMALAYEMTDSPEYLNGSISAMDYLLGRNPNEISYVTGYGTNHSTFVYSCYWAAQLDAENFPLAPSGVLSSGPDSLLSDPFIRSSGYRIGEIAPQCCYIDDIESWSTNQCSMTLNASLAWMSDFMLSNGNEDKKHNNGDDPETTVTTAVTKEPSATQVTTRPSASTEKISYGDIDENGVVEVTDLTNLSLYLLDDIQLKENALKNADVNADGSVNLADLAHLKQYIMNDNILLGV